MPTGSLPEVDTAQAVTGKAKPLAKNDDGSVSTECKVDDLVELTGVQDKQLAPKVETRDVPGAEETIPVSEEPTKEVPKEGALDTPGKHCYQAGDLINGLVRCINVYGAYLEHGDLNVLIPAEGKSPPPFMIGDTVNGTVKRVEDDGTVILDTYLILEEDEEDSSSTLRKWKDSGWGMWWKDSWYAGQWYQNSSDGQWDWNPEEWQSYGWSADQRLSPEEWDEAVQKQLCGEKIYRLLLENRKDEKEYVGKITGVLLDRRMDEVRELVADLALLEKEALAAYHMLIREGWKPSGTGDAGWGKGEYPREQYHNALYNLARQRKVYSAAVTGEAVAMLLDKGGDELWNELWLDSKKFLQELDGAVETMIAKEQKPMEFYLDPDVAMVKGGQKEVKLNLRPATILVMRMGTSVALQLMKAQWMAVDEVQQQREDSAFRAQYNDGKGASKGEPTSGEPKKQMCLHNNREGCRFGDACRYIHDDNAVLEGTWEAGKSWDNASRKAMRDEGFHHCCFDHYLKGRCRARSGTCRFSHDEMSEVRLTRLKHLANMANHVRFQRERGLEITDRGFFKPPVTGGENSSSSSAPQSLQMTNVSKKEGVVDTLDEAEEDVQKDSVAESTTVLLQDPEELIEHWMARNQPLWVYTPHVSEVMIKLGVTNVKELQEYIFVEDLVDKGVNKVTACKILELVGGVRYRPMSPDVAISTNASVRLQQSSGSREAGRDAARTISQVPKPEGHGAREMPRGSYREILNRGRYPEAWTLEQRSPLCVQKLQLVGMGMPPVTRRKRVFGQGQTP